MSVMRAKTARAQVTGAPLGPKPQRSRIERSTDPATGAITTRHYRDGKLVATQVNQPEGARGYSRRARAAIARKRKRR